MHIDPEKRVGENKNYSRESYDRLYGNKDIVSSKDQYTEKHLTVEERARFIYEGGYIDKDTITFEEVIAMINELDAKAQGYGK